MRIDGGVLFAGVGGYGVVFASIYRTEQGETVHFGSSCKGGESAALRIQTVG